MKDATTLLLMAAAVVTALGVVSGGAWWLLGPRVREFIAKTSEAAELARHELQPNSGGSLHDQATKGNQLLAHVVDRLDRASDRLAGVEHVVTEHLGESGRGVERLYAVERAQHATARRLDELAQAHGDVVDQVADLAHQVREVVQGQRSELTVYRALLAGAGLLNDDEHQLVAVVDSVNPAAGGGASSSASGPTFRRWRDEAPPT